MRITAPLNRTACMLRVSKLVAFLRRMTSSMRGCNQPDVVLGVECAPLGVRGEGVGGGGAERRGVRLRMGSESVDEVVRVKDCCELDCANAVDDMSGGVMLLC